MAKKLRVGIIGLGIGRPNGTAIDRNPRGQVVALCDLVESKMDSFERELGHDVKKFVDYREMCRDAEVDAVFVGTPNQLHAPMTQEAARRGKHVLVTKPLADSLRAAERAVKAAESAGVVNMMSLCTRYGPAVRHLGRLAAANHFGELYYARARSVRRIGIPAWNLGFISPGGGAFRDMGVHVLDSAWWLLGRPRPLAVSGVGGAKFGPRGLGYFHHEVAPRSISRKFAVDDYAGGFIRFEGGVGMQVESFWASHQPEQFNVELFGTDAGAALAPLTVYSTRQGAPHDSSVSLPPGRSDWDNVAAHFIDCCLDGTACDAPLRDGLEVQRMMEAMLRSAATGKEMRLA